MEKAWIAGKPAALDSAIAEAAKLLGASRHPLIAGLGTDIAGARAAIALAQRTGAAIDHMHSDAVLRDLDVMRSSGVMMTTPGEIRTRADTLLLVGSGIAETWPDVAARLVEKTLPRGEDSPAERRVLWLCPGGDLAALGSAATRIAAVGKGPGDLPALLGALRARTAGRPLGAGRIASKTLDEVSAALKAARFGVAIWSAATLETLAIEMLCGLVADLNATTRFSTLPLAPGDNAMGVLQVCGWITGFPMRTGFGRKFPEHDPWRFDSRRLVDSGETDCVLWISAYRAAAPEWRKPPATVALTGPDAGFRVPPRAHIRVGRPGVDHPAVEHVAAIGALAPVAATQPSDTISVADAIGRIAAALAGGGERPC